MWGWCASVVLGLILAIPAWEASPLGAVVTLEPLDHGETQEVMAHTSVLVPGPCPSRTEVVCDGNDCITRVTPDPISGQYPSPGWCLRQWQSVIPFRHTSRQTIGSTDVLLSSWADLSRRPDNQEVNRPPVAALLPPLRVSVNCFQRFELSVKDLDGDRVRCRYGNAERDECQICTRHEFLQLDEISCVLVYNGLGETGRYAVELMVEDFLKDVNGESRVLSSTPLQLSLTVEEAASCQASPTFTERTPAGGALFTVLPYEETYFTIEAQSPSGRVSEIAIVGPAGLYTSAMQREEPGSLASVTTAWLRSPNKLPHLLPVCFTANTQSLQSGIRCVWIEQKPTGTLGLPSGTVLQCGSEDMTYSFPISALPGLPLSDLRLNDPSCLVSHNGTHVTGRVSFAGCGTRAVNSGTELVYTNTLRTLPPALPISRWPTLELQLCCRFPAAQVNGPSYGISSMDFEETFGRPSFWIEFRSPDSEVFANGTLDLYIFSNSSLTKAELKVSSCMQSPTADFNTTYPLVLDGCPIGKTIEENVTHRNEDLPDIMKIFRIDLTSFETWENTMYAECWVRLCITMLPSQKCPDDCQKVRKRSLEESGVFSKTYLIRSGPVFVDSRNGTISATANITNHAPEGRYLVMGVAMGVVRMFIQTLLL